MSITQHVWPFKFAPHIGDQVQDPKGNVATVARVTCSRIQLDNGRKLVRIYPCRGHR